MSTIAAPPKAWMEVALRRYLIGGDDAEQIALARCASKHPAPDSDACLLDQAQSLPGSDRVIARLKASRAHSRTRFASVKSP